MNLLNGNKMNLFPMQKFRDFNLTTTKTKYKIILQTQKSCNVMLNDSNLSFGA